MKKTKFLMAAAIVGIATLVAVAADHIDAPAVQGGTSDITDFYAFQGENTSNIAFVANVQGLLGSGSDTQNASFDENVLIEFNIDNTGDNVEDLVIQAIARDGKMYVFGPTAPSQTGLNSTIATNAANQFSVDITPYGQSAIVESSGGMMAFAGPRDDPFFMDFAQYGQIIAGNATGFNNPGADTFAGTNVLSVVVEVPKSAIGGSGTINTWVESKRRQ
ncbi:MAG: molecular chaperone DnaK [Winogradskyella sp.]|nr:molecular chaperone DnaK [Winogradskyella sp.]|tara:strand:- start:6193 stop:6849 length:657 start_codon:yes stop_codon:yes gene_type:complete